MCLSWFAQQWKLVLWWIMAGEECRKCWRCGLWEEEDCVQSSGSRSHCFPRPAISPYAFHFHIRYLKSAPLAPIFPLHIWKFAFTSHFPFKYLKSPPFLPFSPQISEKTLGFQLLLFTLPKSGGGPGPLGGKPAEIVWLTSCSRGQLTRRPLALAPSS